MRDPLWIPFWIVAAWITYQLIMWVIQLIDALLRWARGEN